MRVEDKKGIDVTAKFLEDLQRITKGQKPIHFPKINNGIENENNANPQHYRGNKKCSHH